ncbi:MAG: hypothetical protein RLZZ175_2628 [Bacteroidota bacterium]|jgi:hypothetical protein
MKLLEIKIIIFFLLGLVSCKHNLYLSKYPEGNIVNFVEKEKSSTLFITKKNIVESIDNRINNKTIDYLSFPQNFSHYNIIIKQASFDTLDTLKVLNLTINDYGAGDSYIMPVLVYNKVFFYVFDRISGVLLIQGQLNKNGKSGMWRFYNEDGTLLKNHNFDNDSILSPDLITQKGFVFDK